MTIKKKISAILEAAEYPNTISCRDLQQLVLQWHYDGYSPPEEDDLMNRLDKFDVYKLSIVPAARLHPDVFALSADKVRKYAAMDPTMMPPVIFDTVAGVLIDGAHRAKAALMNGEDIVRVYLGLEQHLDPHWRHQDDTDEADEEWHPDEEY